MPAPFLSRPRLARVLQSLLAAELAAARGTGLAPKTKPPDPGWSDDLALGDGGLGCDSLEVLRLGSAVNEMFHLHETATEADLLTVPRFGAWLDAIEAVWRAGVDTVTFTTSGSTGQPKRCAHPLAHLRAELDVLAGLFVGTRRIVALAPAHHIYGFLFTAALPDRLGVEVWSPDGLGAGTLLHGLRAGDLLVSFPECWSWLDRSIPAWPAEVSGVTSTAPCPPALAGSLAARGLGRLTEVYGSSETAGIAVRHAPDAPYRLMDQWRFATPPGAGEHRLLHRSGWNVTLQDDVQRLDDAETFELRGRGDGAVQVGGTNVFPARVVALLRARPGVRDAAVRLMAPHEGSRLKAFVVPEPDLPEAPLRDALEAWIDRHLATPERPKHIRFGCELPATPHGKAKDWPIG